MALHLQIENETTLPDGGPVSITVTGRRGIDIGRDTHLDWTLPDPTRYISGKHAEIRYRDGAYWLHDVSTNGTLLNGADHRMQAPHRLRDGDRFTIGHYIVAVTLDGEQGESRDIQPPAAAAQPADYDAIWDNVSNVAPPINREQLKAPRDRPAPVNPDFLDWATDVPAPARPAAASNPPRSVSDVMDWAAGPKSPEPPPPQPPPDLPEPRRPRGTSEAMAPWAADPTNREVATPFDRPAKQSPAAGFAPADPTLAMSDAFLQRLAHAAGVPWHLLASKDRDQLADELGAMLRVMVESLMQLLSARHQAKVLARSAHHTVIQPFDNNPLKFSPNVEEALRNMFGPPTRAYLPPLHAVERSFDDLKRHEIKTYSAMQHALKALVSELDPKSIDRSIPADTGISALMTSRKAKLWDTYVTRWEAQMAGEDKGALDRFMRLFSEYYNRDNG